MVALAAPLEFPGYRAVESGIASAHRSIHRTPVVFAHRRHADYRCVSSDMRRDRLRADALARLKGHLTTSAKAFARRAFASSR
jgi:hypothetical protein